VEEKPSLASGEKIVSDKKYGHDIELKLISVKKQKHKNIGKIVIDFH